jgi:hypothetical protein
MKLKALHFVDVAEIQEVVTYELKKVQKRGIFGSFSKNVRPRKRLYIYIYANGAYFEFEIKVFFLIYLRFKKNSPKTFGQHCVISAVLYNGRKCYDFELRS